MATRSTPPTPAPRMRGRWMLLSAALVAALAWFGFPWLKQYEARRRATSAYGVLLPCLCGPQLDCSEQAMAQRWLAVTSQAASEEGWPRACTASATQLLAALLALEKAGGCSADKLCGEAIGQTQRLHHALDPADEWNTLAVGALRDALDALPLAFEPQPPTVSLPSPPPLLDGNGPPIHQQPAVEVQLRRRGEGISLLLARPHHSSWCQLDLERARVVCQPIVGGRGVPRLDLSGSCVMQPSADATELRVFTSDGDYRLTQSWDIKPAAASSGLPPLALCDGRRGWLQNGGENGTLFHWRQGTAMTSQPRRKGLPRLTRHGIVDATPQGLTLQRSDGSPAWQLPLAAAELGRIDSCPSNQQLALFGVPQGHNTAVTVVSLAGATPAVANSVVSSPYFAVHCHAGALGLSWLDGADERRLASDRNPSGRALRGRYTIRRTHCTSSRCTTSESEFEVVRHSPSGQQLFVPLGDALVMLWQSPRGDVRAQVDRQGQRGPVTPLLRDGARTGLHWDGVHTQALSLGERALLLVPDRRERLHGFVLEVSPTLRPSLRRVRQAP